MSLIKDLGCIRLHMGPLADGVKKHAQQWIKMYGAKLQESASQNLVSLQEILVVSICMEFPTYYCFRFLCVCMYILIVAKQAK